METTNQSKRGESLTESAFLLAFDLRKERLVGQGEMGYLLRAAALAELFMHGGLTDDSGKPRAATAAPAGVGILPTTVWEQIANSPPRPWRRWVAKDYERAFRLVRDELEEARLINVTRHGIFRTTLITPRRPYLSRRLAEQVAQAVRSGRPTNRLERDIQVLAALAAAARLKPVMPQAEWKGHKRRIETLSAPVEPVTTALRASLDAHSWSQLALGG